MRSEQQAKLLMTKVKRATWVGVVLCTIVLAIVANADNYVIPGARVGGADQRPVMQDAVTTGTDAYGNPVLTQRVISAAGAPVITGTLSPTAVVATTGTTVWVAGKRVVNMVFAASATGSILLTSGTIPVDGTNWSPTFSLGPVPGFVYTSGSLVLTSGSAVIEYH